MENGAIDRIDRMVRELCSVPGLSGHEQHVAAEIGRHLGEIGLAGETDVLGNLFATMAGRGDAPSVLLFAHMDQLGLVVRKIEPDGFLRFERLGGIPESSLPGQRVAITTEFGTNVPGVIASKSHHAALPEEKYTVLRCAELYIDAGFECRSQAEQAGVKVGSPVVYQPRVDRLHGNRILGTSLDDRAGCAVMLEVARSLAERPPDATVHFLFSVQEEFNLRGAMPVARQLNPDIAIQIDLMLAEDTPDMTRLGDVKLGHGPGISMYSFHGRGTLNGVLPHPGLVRLLEQAADRLNIPLQRIVHMGLLTDLSYVQSLGKGVACLEAGFPVRYSHSAGEVCDLGDLAGLSEILAESIRAIEDRRILDRT